MPVTRRVVLGSVAASLGLSALEVAGASSASATAGSLGTPSAPVIVDRASLTGVTFSPDWATQHNVLYPTYVELSDASGL